MRPSVLLLPLMFVALVPVVRAAEGFDELAKKAASYVAVRENPRLFIGKLAKVEGEVIGVATRPDGSAAFLLRDEASGAVVYIEGRLPEGEKVEAGRKLRVVGEVVLDRRSAFPWLKLRAFEEGGLSSPPSPAEPVEGPKEGPNVTPLEPTVLLPPMPVKWFEIVPKEASAVVQRPARPSPGLPSRLTARPSEGKGRAAVSRGEALRGLDLQRWLAAWRASTIRVVKFFNPSLSEALATRIADALLVASYKHNVDPRLVAAVVAAESSFNPNAVSKKGAMGLGQIMPENAAALGIDPFNIEQNLDATAYYLRKYLDMYAGRPNQLQLALAAYNAGPGAVAKYGGVPPYRETQNYVRLVLYYYRCLRGER